MVRMSKQVTMLVSGWWREVRMSLSEWEEKVIGSVGKLVSK